jgi:hypothetical protein
MVLIGRLEVGTDHGNNDSVVVTSGGSEAT